MALFDLFRTKWSSETMTDEDRQIIFWLLKRNTSYTAWKRCSDRFSTFADIVEKQLREQPSVLDKWGDKISWEPVYISVLKGQVHYESALNRLKAGDRTVFLYNSLGEFIDATRISNEWHSEIVNGGRDAEPNKYPGKYVDDMTAALKWFFLASSETGYLQPQMDGLSAVETWEKERHDRLLRLSFPHPLMKVPAGTEITVKTGDPAPVFGIYEPQVKDGCMNYLLQGVPARSYSETPVSYAGQAVTWRLIWEDRRYQDGAIPEEEAGYFPPEYEAKQRALFEAEIEEARSENQLITSDSRNMAPKAGRWLLSGDLSTATEIAKQGDIMPLYKDREVTWIWAASDAQKISAYSSSR